MSNKFVSDEQKQNITENLLSDFDEKGKQIEELFKKIQKQDDEQKKENIETNEIAVKEFTNLFKPKTFSLKIADMTFFFKYNLSIYEYEQLKNIDPQDINSKLKFFHSLVIEPKIPYDLFKDLPAEYISYAEQKIYDFFLQNMASIQK